MCAERKHNCVLECELTCAHTCPHTPNTQCTMCVCAEHACACNTDRCDTQVYNSTKTAIATVEATMCVHGVKKTANLYWLHMCTCVRAPARHISCKCSEHTCARSGRSEHKLAHGRNARSRKRQSHLRLRPSRSVCSHCKDTHVRTGGEHTRTYTPSEQERTLVHFSILRTCLCVHCVKTIIQLYTLEAKRLFTGHTCVDTVDARILSGKNVYVQNTQLYTLVTLVTRK